MRINTMAAFFIFKGRHLRGETVIRPESNVTLYV